MYSQRDQDEQPIKSAGRVRCCVTRDEHHSQQFDNDCCHTEHAGCERTLQALGQAAEPVKRIKLHEGAEYTENAGNGERCTVCAVRSDGAAELPEQQRNGTAQPEHGKPAGNGNVVVHNLYLLAIIIAEKMKICKKKQSLSALLLCDFTIY